MDGWTDRRIGAIALPDSLMWSVNIGNHQPVSILLLLQPFNDPLSGTTQVSRYQKDKPFWILLKQT